MALAVNDIVTVFLAECIYHKEQGQIVEIKNDGDPDGSIAVKFGRWRKIISFGEEEVTVRFQESELRKDADWSLDVKIFRCYGRDLYHTVYTYQEPFDVSHICGAEGCEGGAIRRCLINIWGNVYEIDLCAICANAYDGKCGEFFPQKVIPLQHKIN